jgi:hypothetical protein
VSSLELRRDIVILACAISAGIHGALVPGHFDEGTGAGLGFATATIALTVLVIWLTRQPASAIALAAAAAVFAGLLANYAVATTTGLPLLHPDPERVDGLALATKAIEAIGLLAALHLLRRGRPAVAVALQQPKGTLTWAHHGLRAPSRLR